MSWHRLRIVVPLILCSALMIAPTGVLAQDAPPAYWSLERFHWNGELGEGKPVRIENLHGDVRVRDAGNRELEVSAVIQKDARDPLAAHVEVGETAEELHIEVLYRSRESSAAAEADDLIRRVDLVVFLPVGNPLVARTDRGLLEAKGLQSVVEATTTLGDIVVSTDRRVALRSQHGAISAVLAATAWQEPTVFATVTGDIRVELPRGADALVTATTTGEITTDFSIVIERSEQGFHKRARAKIGNGACPLQIVTEKGAVKLLEAAF